MTYYLVKLDAYLSRREAPAWLQRLSGRVARWAFRRELRRGGGW